MHGFERYVIDGIRHDIWRVTVDHALHVRILIVDGAMNVSFQESLWRIGVYGRCVCDMVFDEVAVGGDECWGEITAHEAAFRSAISSALFFKYR